MSQQAGTLRSQIKTSAMLSSVRYASEIGLRLISTVVLSRLLAPEIYGVFAIVLAYMYLLEMFSDLGLRSLILTREGTVSDRFLQTCWTVSILRGVAILLLSGLLALGVYGLQVAEVFALDSAYSAPDLPLALLGLGAATLLFSFESPLRFMREREMAFGRVTAVDLVRNLLTLVVTVVLAYYLRSVWALVIGSAVRAGLHVGFSFAVFRGVPMRLCLDRESLRVLIDRGKWILGQSGLTAVSNSLDRVLLGVAMNSTTFGFYYMARQLVDMIPGFLNPLNGQMGVQVFSRLHQQSREDFRRNYYRYRLVFDAIAGLAAGGMLVLAPLIVAIIFDDRYAGVAPLMQVLVLGVLLFGPQIMRSVLVADRQFRLTTLMSLLGAAVLLGGLCLAIFVFDSVPAALLVVALHKLPEALALTLAGGRRGWIILWREPAALAFCAIGAGLGWIVLWIWNFVT